MNKFINIGIIVSITLLAGVVAYNVTHKSNKNTSSQNETISQVNGVSTSENCDNQFLNGVRPVIENKNLKKYLMVILIKDLKHLNFKQSKENKNKMNEFKILKNNEEVFWTPMYETINLFQDNNCYGILEFKNLKDIEITIFEDIKDFSENCSISIEVIKEN